MSRGGLRGIYGDGIQGKLDGFAVVSIIEGRSRAGARRHSGGYGQHFIGGRKGFDGVN